MPHRSSRQPKGWAFAALLVGVMALPTAASAQKVRAKAVKVKGSTMAASVRKVARERSTRNKPSPGARTLARKTDGNAAHESKLVRRAHSKRERQHNRIPRTVSGTNKRLAESGLGDKTLALAAEHLSLGLPTDANRTNQEDFLIVRNQYVLSYSKSRKIPNWVSWKLASGDLGKGARKNNFRADLTIPKRWGRATDRDYKRSGYTRGPIVAAGERQNSIRANSKTFVFTNIVPQLEANNTGPWLHLEEHYREQAELHGQEVHIVAGGIFEGLPKTIGANHVAVPSSTWKVAVFLDKGQKISDISADTRVVSIIVPNVEGAVHKSEPFTKYRVTPKEIEQRAGVKLFAHLPAGVRESLRNKVDTVVVDKRKAKQLRKAKKAEQAKKAKAAEAAQQAPTAQ